MASSTGGADRDSVTVQAADRHDRAKAGRRERRRREAFHDFKSIIMMIHGQEDHGRTASSGATLAGLAVRRLGGNPGRMEDAGSIVLPAESGWGLPRRRQRTD
jgi:hypothetical protein